MIKENEVDNKLTPEQIKLVEDNHSLIFYILRKHNIKYDDEWYGVLAIALCKAALRFKPELGYKFVTYAYHTLEGAYKNQVRYLLGDINCFNTKALSIDSLTTENGTAFGFDTIFADITMKDFVDDVIFRDMLEYVRNNIKSDKKKKIFELFLSNLAPKEIAEIMHVSYQYVYRIQKEFYELYQRYNARC